MEILQKEFTIAAPPEKVWDMLGKVIYRCLPLEKMDIVDETTFRAVLRWRWAFIKLPLNLKVKLVDISPPSSLGSLIRVKKGMIDMVIKVSFTLTPVNEGKTEVVCTALDEGERNVPGWLMRGQQRSFAEEMFDSIRERLAQH